MQAAVAGVALPDGPCLALIEDATGAGKTEAATILAHRMIAAGKAGGLFFALPTMATSEAMFSRMRPMLRRLFDGQPSLALLHGKRALSENFAQVRSAQGTRPEDGACSQWIADDRRLSLMAEIGVGTIDQALMAVLPVGDKRQPASSSSLSTCTRFKVILGSRPFEITLMNSIHAISFWVSSSQRSSG